MSQTIVLLGATYSDVPAVDLPTSSGTARFMDTSDATATAATILDGYTAYIDGSKITGTATGGGVDGDNIAYGGAYVGSAIVGSAILAS